MPKKRIWIYALLFSAVTINYVDREALSVAAPSIAGTYHLDPVQLGYLFSAFLWTYFVFAMPWGLATDHFGTRRTTAVGMVWWSLATIATAVIGWSYGLILATRLAMGMGEASTYPASERVLREAANLDAELPFDGAAPGCVAHWCLCGDPLCCRRASLNRRRLDE